MENNNDGTNDNDSWNCGAEGWTDDAGSTPAAADEECSGDVDN